MFARLMGLKTCGQIAELPNTPEPAFFLLHAAITTLTFNTERPPWYLACPTPDCKKKASAIGCVDELWRVVLTLPWDLGHRQRLGVVLLREVQQAVPGSEPPLHIFLCSC